jgi:hypothetical protein
VIVGTIGAQLVVEQVIAMTELVVRGGDLATASQRGGEVTALLVVSRHPDVNRGDEIRDSIAESQCGIAAEHRA